MLNKYLYRLVFQRCIICQILLPTSSRRPPSPRRRSSTLTVPRSSPLAGFQWLYHHRRLPAPALHLQGGLQHIPPMDWLPAPRIHLQHGHLRAGQSSTHPLTQSVCPLSLKMVTKPRAEGIIFQRLTRADRNFKRSTKSMRTPPGC